MAVVTLVITDVGSNGEVETELKSDGEIREGSLSCAQWLMESLMKHMCSIGQPLGSRQVN